jgi:hypothetical protein
VIRDKRGAREAKEAKAKAKMQAAKQKLLSIEKQKQRRTCMNATAIADADVQAVLSGTPDAAECAARTARIEDDLARTAEKAAVAKRKRTDDVDNVSHTIAH